MNSTQTKTSSKKTVSINKPKTGRDFYGVGRKPCRRHTCGVKPKREDFKEIEKEINEGFHHFVNKNPLRARQMFV